MSAAAPGAVGPVSVRYAAQIRELLFAQAMQRMAAEQEAVRASDAAERAASADAAKTKPDALNARLDAATAPEASAPVRPPEPKSEPVPGQLVDIQA